VNSKHLNACNEDHKGKVYTFRKDSRKNVSKLLSLANK